jgi:hypothetical protein
VLSSVFVFPFGFAFEFVFLFGFVFEPGAAEPGTEWPEPI